MVAKLTVYSLVLGFVALVVMSYGSRASKEATSIRDAACNAHVAPSGTCTRHDQLHKENLGDYCAATARQCDKWLSVTIPVQTIKLITRDVFGIEHASQGWLWAGIILSSPATWCVILGIVAMAFIVSYGPSGSFLDRFLTKPRRDDIPVAIPIGPPPPPDQVHPCWTTGKKQA